MRQYAVKRIALIIPTVLLVSLIVFTVMRLLPGDPALVILSEGDASFTQEELEDRHRSSHCRPVRGLDRRAITGRFRDFHLAFGAAGHQAGWRPRLQDIRASSIGDTDRRGLRRALGGSLRYQAGQYN